jgi:hypothetical protein
VILKVLNKESLIK